MPWDIRLLVIEHPVPLHGKEIPAAEFYVGAMMLGRMLRRPAVIVLCSINLVIMIGYGLIMPVLPFYAGSMGANGTQLGLLFASYSMTQFLLSPYWGRFSDRSGRRPVILWGLLGFALTFLLFGLANNLLLLFIARLLGGGLSCAAIPASMAYMADVTDESERGDGMALMGTSAGLGIVLGPIIGGYLAEVSIELPFFVATGITLLIAVAAFFFLPESLDDDSRNKQILSPAAKLKNFGRRSQLAEPLGFLLILTLAINFASANLESTFGLFLEARLGFGGREVGLAFTVAGVAMVLAQGFIVGPMIKRFGEESLIVLGLVFSATSYLFLLIAQNLAGLLLIMGTMAFLTSGMRPAMSTLFSKRTSAQDQGLIQGEQNRYAALGRIVGPFTGGLLFDVAGSASPYIFGALIYFGGLIASTKYLNWRKPQIGVPLSTD
ncbi:MAG TPA: MFS transporter [Anaerolineae bacterium]|nr:MFS transporter [Anaerolineae bacterium]